MKKRLINQSKNSILYERCVCCGKMTDVLKDVNIAQRKGYIQGAGQLCRECYDKLYPFKNEGE